MSFGNTHALGATVSITCTTGGQAATVEGYDQVDFSVFRRDAIVLIAILVDRFDIQIVCAKTCAHERLSSVHR